jgi:class 3 adenylate cyclase
VIIDEIEEFLTGARRPPVADRILATVLFTDLAGSTERASTLGDERWTELLERHRRLVRRHLARFRGREIDIAGDGFFALFDGPARAIRCAHELVRATRDLDLELRAGLHPVNVKSLRREPPVSPYTRGHALPRWPSRERCS